VDETAQQIVERYSEKLGPILAEQVDVVSEVISKRPQEGSYDTPLGNLVSDIFKTEAGTDLAFYNRGGVRFDMASGPLTVEDVHKLFPFDDPVVVLEARGEQIRQIVEQGTVDGEGPLSASGLTALIKDGTVTSIKVNGAPLDPKARYTIATTRFLAGGGDGMEAFSQLKRARELPFTRDVLLRYLESLDLLESPGTGRLSSP
jgi:2',3'-cyclic-nucleotide 2'-phosphodiesterase (5'-nucleotidase family)